MIRSENRHEGAFLRAWARGLLCAVLIFSFLAATALPAQAVNCVACEGSCQMEEAEDAWEREQDQGLDLMAFITLEFKRLQLWLVDDFFRIYIVPTLRRLSGQLTGLGLYQVGIFAEFLDAKQQLNVQRTMHELAAEAHRDYHSSIGMCTMGTISLGMAPAYAEMGNAVHIIARQAITRQLGSIDSNAAQGRDMDRQGRLEQFKREYCDPNENDGDLYMVCEEGAPAHRVNRDIDFEQMFSTHPTLQATMDDEDYQEHEADIFALSNNLFAHDLFERSGTHILGRESTQANYLHMRALVAKRSVAVNTFANIAGMHVRGVGGEEGEREFEYAGAVMRQMGYPEEDVDFMLGIEPREIDGEEYFMPDKPSYFQLLEMITQKIYQNPQFYANLYDKPAETARKDVAMQAVGLMLDRDNYKSELRYEALLAVLLELELAKHQEKVFGRMNWIVPTDKESDE